MNNELLQPITNLKGIGKDLAAVLSLPVAIKGSQMYLELFPNRIDFPWWLLVVSVLVTLLIAFLSICWRTLSVARRNPVESIRTE